jgi:hypothetical protein
MFPSRTILLSYPDISRLPWRYIATAAGSRDAACAADGTRDEGPPRERVLIPLLL